MTGKFLIYLGVGKLIIYLVQKFVSSNSKSEFFNKLISCDLCLGTWVYCIIALAFKVVILEDVFTPVPILSELITGAVTTFGVHLLYIGWREKFSVVVI